MGNSKALSVGWTGWGRLDDLDRSRGFGRQWTRTPIQLWGWFMWAGTVINLVVAVMAALQGQWVQTALAAAAVVVGLLYIRIAVPELRERAGLG